MGDFFARFAVEDNRVIMLFNDGSKAWEAKDYLIQQDRCAEVTIEGRNYPGKGAPQPANEPTTPDTKTEL